MKKNRVILAALTVLTLSEISVTAKSLEEETQALAVSLAKQLVSKQRSKVAALDFTNIQAQSNELGRFLSDQLAVDMVSQEGITMLDRANISSVMAEHQLTTEGLVRPENAKKLGQFAGVDALLIGSLATMDSSFVLTVKAISTETAEIVAAGRCKFDITEDLMKQYSTAINGGAASTGGGGTASNGNSGTSGRESPGIATKKFDNIELILKSVRPSSAQVRRGYETVSLPVVSCAIEIFNRDLKNTAVIAVNGQLADSRNAPPTVSYGGNTMVAVGLCRGALIDEAGNKWEIPAESLNGISTILAFDVVDDINGTFGVKQLAPASIVDYIRKAKKCDFGNFDNNNGGKGKYWAGDFTAIPPGRSLRVSVPFLAPLHGNQNQRPELPTSFQLGMEFVVGTTNDVSNHPKTANNLRLENLVFDRIEMPSDDRK